MSSFKKWMPFFGIVLFLFLLLGGCSRSGSLKPNQPPTITITSYGGSDSLSNKLEPFQQKIFWEAHDVDGVVKYYAYRVLDIDRNPVSTSGHQYIDADGWVYHYKDGVNVTENTPPPNTPGYGTIWTKDLFAIINFPAHDAQGDSANVASIFEVKCMDNRGSESNIASKIFNVYSNVPEVVFVDKEIINEKIVGQGLSLSFSIRDNDLGLEEGDLADHYEFMLKKKSSITGEYMPVENYYQWYSIYKSNNSFHLELSKLSTPKLDVNTYNSIYDTFLDSTIIVYRVMDIAGIYSQPDSFTVAVKTGFHPGTLIYNDVSKTDVCFALGKYHYSMVNTSTGSINVPSFQNSSGDEFYAIPPFTNLDGERVLIGSDNIKIYMKWGWKGEYNNDDPGQKKENTVQDEETGKNYFSKIKSFLVRLDNKPLYLPYLPAEGENLYIDEDGKEWLLIPSSHYNFQEVILTRITLEHSSGNLYGNHKFEVKAIDLQGIADPTPAEYVFKIIKYLPEEERSGILVLDNDSNAGSYAGIDEVYNDLLADHVSNIDFVYTAEGQEYKNMISITDYIKYKFIILHSEKINQPTEETKIKRMFTALQMYLDFGGNLMITGGANLKDDITYLNGVGFGGIFNSYFGVTVPASSNTGDYALDVYQDNTGQISDYQHLQFFMGGTPTDDYPTLTFDYDNSVLIDPFLGLSANTEHALGPVSYITLPTEAATPIYYFKPIEPGDGPHQLTESQYEELSNYVVAQKKVTEHNKCYIFTFPLSYMEKEHAKELFNKIIDEVMGQ